LEIAYYAGSFAAVFAPFAASISSAHITQACASSPATQGSEAMANTAQARKRARQAEATRQRNASQKSALRTAVKKVKKAIAAGDKSAATTVFRESQAVIDRIADKRIVHKNLAARTKSRLAQAIKALA
jgi:small subunit ribosomal protein S20